jgi:hypothetical protein
VNMQETPLRNERGHFLPGQTGNPSGRRPNVEPVRRLLELHRDELVAKAIALALAGDSTALRICFDRLAPVPKSETPASYVSGLAEAIGLTAKASAVLDAVAGAEISPDVGERLLAALANYAKIVEVDDLARRIGALETKGIL